LNTREHRADTSSSGYANLGSLSSTWMQRWQPGGWKKGTGGTGKRGVRSLVGHKKRAAVYKLENDFIHHRNKERKAGRTGPQLGEQLGSHTRGIGSMHAKSGTRGPRPNFHEGWRSRSRIIIQTKGSGGDNPNAHCALHHTPAQQPFTHRPQSMSLGPQDQDGRAKVQEMAQEAHRGENTITGPLGKAKSCKQIRPRASTRALRPRRQPQPACKASIPSLCSVTKKNSATLSILLPLFRGGRDAPAAWAALQKSTARADACAGEAPVPSTRVTLD
jgi:hypothetical protein